MKFLVIQERYERKLNGPHISLTLRTYVFALLQRPLTTLRTGHLRYVPILLPAALRTAQAAGI